MSTNGRARAAPRSLRGYLRARASELARPATRAVSDPLAEWAVRRVRIDGRPFRFEGHEYLRGLYDDTSQHIVVIKGAQLGGTTWAVLKGFHACVNGLNVLYLFPTKTDVIEFSKSRVTPLLEDNRFIKNLVRDTDTAGLKRIGQAYMYFRGMQSTVSIKSIPIDSIVYDELDEAPPEAKSLARERLAHSDYKRIVELSNPSLPAYGIDEVFQQSDQRHWTLRCDGCGKWTALDKEFPLSLGEEVKIIRERDEGEFFRACPKCGNELDLAQGEWVPDFPGRRIHGYRVSQLLLPKVDAGEILHDYRTTRYAELFYRMKLARAWSDTSNRLDQATVLACCGDHGLLEKSDTRCTMGIDVGKQMHIVVSRWIDHATGRREVVWIGTRSSFSELDELMERFNVQICVIDAQPELHAAREFARRHLGGVWLNYFVDSQRGEYDWDWSEYIVRENRTEAMDACRQMIRERKIVLPRGSRVVRELAEHLEADVKDVKENPETGKLEPRYIKTGKPNHYGFAFVYDSIAASRDVYLDPNDYGWFGPDDS